mmetsp:Transcript_138968/g.443747  ORF Transcript_138968/g.443747 Transcript_138968/m.443747 type:complete len:307 (-) Transcript_138968:33-953(-)
MARPLWDNLAPFACCRRFDVGIVECSLAPVHYEERFGGCAPSTQAASASAAGRREARSASSAFEDPFGCQDPLRLGDGNGLPICCTVDEADSTEKLFQPCLICAVRPASVVEVPCGHITVCIDCYGDYQTNARCLVCRAVVAARVDVRPFLDLVTGRPADCNVCKEAAACVVTVPCVHMTLCARCLPMKPAGCPMCGEIVEQSCAVKWPSPDRCFRPPSTRPGSAASEIGDMRMPSSTLGTMTPRTAGSARRECLSKATEDVDQEILRLERQLLQLRSLSSLSTTPGVAGTLKEARPPSRPSSVHG